MSTSDPRQGLHHLGLATHDMEATLAFYEKTLGFETRVCEMIEPETGGSIRHAFIDCGNGELLAFMEPNDVRGVPADFDPGINRGLGIHGGMIHFAFACRDSEALAARRQELLASGIEVTEVVDHGWCRSIYFHDPNGIQLEYCCTTAEFGESHVAQRNGSTWKRLAREQGDR